jgi:hypothetical protein
MLINKNEVMTFPVGLLSFVSNYLPLNRTGGESLNQVALNESEEQTGWN